EDYRPDQGNKSGDKQWSSSAKEVSVAEKPPHCNRVSNNEKKEDRLIGIHIGEEGAWRNKKIDIFSKFGQCNDEEFGNRTRMEADKRERNKSAEGRGERDTSDSVQDTINELSEAFMEKGTKGRKAQLCGYESPLTMKLNCEEVRKDTDQKDTKTYSEGF
ncbi:hypothetical protein Ancab_033185, partial [Ancistrocladus abbreviatus]